MADRRLEVAHAPAALPASDVLGGWSPPLQCGKVLVGHLARRRRPGRSSHNGCPVFSIVAELALQIVVFPEYAITGDGTTDGDELTRAGADMLSEAVPDPGGATPPCDAPDGGTVYPVTSRLSCMARKSAVVLVADLLDRQPCEAPADPGCADGKFLFNTAVAFDPQGQLIAKYHKRHLYGGEGRTLDRGSQPAGARFNTSFGVEFGLFICFDLLFINGSIPPSDVAFPTDWVNFDQGGLPVERSVDAQRIWSGLHRRNLLASNYGGAMLLTWA